MKMPVFKIFAYKHFFLKTLVQISTSTEVNHLISKELYQKQNTVCNLTWFWATKVCLQASKVSKICLFSHPTGRATS